MDGAPKICCKMVGTGQDQVRKITRKDASGSLTRPGIRRWIRQIIAAVYVYSGLHGLLMAIQGKNSSSIVVYHKPTPKIFLSHLEYFLKRFNVITMSTLVEAIRQRDWAGIPPRSLVITIDDGCKEIYGLLPLFREFRVIPALFLCSRIVDTRRRFWWEDASIDVRELKKMPCGELFASLREKTGFDPDTEYPDREALNLPELQEMSRFVEYGSHSKYHPVLTRCGDERCLEEIEESKKELEAMLGEPIVHFVYPNGDYGDREVDYLKRCGYRSGRTLDIGRNGVDADPYRLKAFSIEDDASINILRAQVSGFFGYIRYLRHGSFRGKRPPSI